MLISGHVSIAGLIRNWTMKIIRLPFLHRKDKDAHYVSLRFATLSAKMELQMDHLTDDDDDDDDDDESHNEE